MIELCDIVRARENLRSVVHHTPMDSSQTFSRLSHNQIHLKLENMQRTGSFKIRGAHNFISALDPATRPQGVIAASAGNHAQGVAYAAQASGIPATIIMPEGTPISKIQATRSYGARVVLDGLVFDDSLAIARQRCKETGATLVHAFDHPLTIAGQGTLGLEIIEDLPEVEAIVVPIGGGGLIAGIALAAKAAKPDITLIGVEAEGAASAKRSLERGTISPLAETHTIADGISVKAPGEMTFEIMKQYLDDVVTVTDDEIASAVLLLIERAKVVAEGAGAASLAAMLYHKTSLSNKTTAAVISGGNIDANFVSRIIEKGLVKTGMRLSLSTVIPDNPGNLTRLLTTIAENRANVLSINHDRLDAKVSLDKVEIGVVLETEGLDHASELVRTLQAEGYGVKTEGKDPNPGDDPR